MFSLLGLRLFSQPFTLQPSGLLNVGRSSLAWGDYDNDGDLDLLLSGDPVTTNYALKIYRNDGGVFTDINANLTGLYNSAVAWGDFDNDSDLDILATGRSASNSNTWLYRNKNGEFVPVSAGFPQIGSDGAVAWGDYDGDGDLDALIAGNFSCKLFNNDNGIFTEVQASLPDISNGWVDWGDYDNDGDLDIFLTGDLGGILTTAIYRNDKDHFTEVQCGMTPLIGSSASWYDADGDHDLDLIVCGFDEYLEPRTLIYENLGSLQFRMINPYMADAALGTVSWGDYDNDGDADVLVTGQNPACGSLSSLVYRNEGGFVFTNISAGLTGTERGSAAWGDYDNDGDLDIIITGLSGSGSPLTLLYRNDAGNNNFQLNTPPFSPTELSSTVNGHQVLLKWNPATDNNTPSSALSYNLRIGSSPNGNEILPSMSNPADGYRLIPLPGNVSNDTSWVLNLPDGNYYWSVQALDHSFSGSQFAEEQQFTVLNVGMPESVTLSVEVTNNPFSDKLIIRSYNKINVSVYDSFGRQVVNSSKAEIVQQFETGNWPAGIYFAGISDSEGFRVIKVIKSPQ